MGILDGIRRITRRRRGGGSSEPRTVIVYELVRYNEDGSYTVVTQSNAPVDPESAESLLPGPGHYALIMKKVDSSTGRVVAQSIMWSKYYAPRRRREERSEESEEEEHEERRRRRKRAIDLDTILRDLNNIMEESGKIVDAMSSVTKKQVEIVNKTVKNTVSISLEQIRSIKELARELGMVDKDEIARLKEEMYQAMTTMLMEKLGELENKIIEAMKSSQPAAPPAAQQNPLYDFIGRYLAPIASKVLDKYVEEILGGEQQRSTKNNKRINIPKV